MYEIHFQVKRDYKYISIEQFQKHVNITLADEKRRNALSPELMEEITDAIAHCKTLPLAQLILLKSTGPVFSAGADLRYLSQANEPNHLRNYATRLYHLLKEISLSPLPVLTVVNGPAYGGGMGLIAASDIVISRESARFSFSEIKLGLVPALISPWIFRKIPLSKAGELMLTGRTFDAWEAYETNLVHKVFADNDFEKRTEPVAESFYQNAPGATREVKQLVLEQNGFSGYLQENESYLIEKFTATLSGDEARKGMEAFLNKSKIVW